MIPMIIKSEILAGCFKSMHKVDVHAFIGVNKHLSNKSISFAYIFNEFFQNCHYNNILR